MSSAGPEPMLDYSIGNNHIYGSHAKQGHVPPGYSLVILCPLTTQFHSGPFSTLPLETDLYELYFQVSLALWLLIELGS